MRKKDALAIDKILECSMKEFMDKGFEKASMRNIAENAGYTTGILYSRYSSKDELFHELVKEGADELYSYYLNSQNEFALYSPKEQYDTMHNYVHSKITGFLDIIYNNFDAFKLIVCKSKGSQYEYYIDKLIDIETKNTNRFIKQLHEAKLEIKEVRADLSHMLATARFSGIFEVVAHDLSRVDAEKYIMDLECFFNAGWDKILGLKN